MDIVISNTSGDPIYQQIFEQISAQIIKGLLPSDTCLPPIRTVAKELRISVITTKRAYEDLERDGFIETFAGKGSFVAAKNTEFLREEALRQIENAFANGVDIALRSGVTADEMRNILSILLEEN